MVTNTTSRKEDWNRFATVASIIISNWRRWHIWEEKWDFIWKNINYCLWNIVRYFQSGIKKCSHPQYTPWPFQFFRISFSSDQISLKISCSRDWIIIGKPIITKGNIIGILCKILGGKRRCYSNLFNIFSSILCIMIYCLAYNSLNGVIEGASVFFTLF